MNFFNLVDGYLLQTNNNTLIVKSLYFFRPKYLESSTNKN